MDRRTSLPAHARGESGLVVGVVSGSHFVNHMYLVLLPPILGLLAVEFDVGLAALGIALGAGAFANTLCQLPFGYLSDTRSRTLTLGLCLGIGTTGVFVTALAPTYAWLVAGQVALGIGVAGHHPSHFPLLADATPESHRGRAFSVHGFAGSIGFAAAPAIITAVLAVDGLTWRHALGLIGVVGGLYGAVAIALLRWRVADEVTTGGLATVGSGVAGPLARARSRLAQLAGSPAILALAVIALVSSTAAWGVTSYAVVLLTDAYGVGESLARLSLTGMFAASAVMILVGGALADRVSAGPVMVASYALVAVVVGVLAVQILPPLAAVVGVVLVGAVRSPSAPARSKLADAVSARTDLGQNFAAITVGIMLGSTVAPPAFGWIIERSGHAAAFLGVAATAVVALVVTLWVLSRYATGFAGADVATPGDD